jgi:hypothetical protein
VDEEEQGCGVAGALEAADSLVRAVAFTVISIDA